jgi:nucleoside-diphosphate-sugar epimerase
MKKNKLLLTGAAGFIGSNLAIKLIKESVFELHLLDRDEGRLEKLKKELSEYSNCDRIFFKFNDISDASVIKDIENGFYDVVVHLAAVPRVAYSVENPSDTFWENCQKSVQIFEACAKSSTRVVFASSSSVYGDNVQMPTKESERLGPKSPYALQKMSAEKCATMLSELVGLDAVSLRFFNVYGPRQLADNAYATVISAWMSACMKNGKLRLDGDGTQERDFCYVDDVCNAIKLCIDHKTKWRGQVYNVAQANCHSLKWVLNWFVNKFNLDLSKDITEAPPRLGDVKKTLADMSLASSELNFHPSWPLEQGLEATYQWWIKEAQKKS